MFVLVFDGVVVENDQVFSPLFLDSKLKINIDITVAMKCQREYQTFTFSLPGFYSFIVLIICSVGALCPQMLVQTF